MCCPRELTATRWEKLDLKRIYTKPKGIFFERDHALRVECSWGLQENNPTILHRWYCGPVKTRWKTLLVCCSRCWRELRLTVSVSLDPQKHYRRFQGCGRVWAQREAPGSASRAGPCAGGRGCGMCSGRAAMYCSDFLLGYHH